MAKFKLNDARAAFLNVFKPQSINGGDPRYGASLLIAPTHAQVKAVKAEMKRVAVEKWGAKADKIYAALEAQNKLALHDGDTKSDYDGFEGMLYIAANNKTRPSAFDGRKAPIDAESGILYSGCDVNAVIEFWAQDHKDFGKRINASLLGIQFLRDNDQFGGGSKAGEEDFDEIEAPAEVDLEA